MWLRFTKHLFLVTCLVININSCGGYTGPSVEQFNDTSVALHVIINSDPPGAKIYGVKDNDIGTFIGETPYTFKYIYKRIGDRPNVWGEHFNETIAQGDNIYEYMANSPFFFQCILVKDGYKIHKVYKKLENRERPDPRHTTSSSAFLPGVETITVPLEQL